MKYAISAVIILFNISLYSQEKILTPLEMQGDIEVLRSAFMNLHPGLYKFNTPQQIEEYFRQLKAQTYTPLSEREFFLLLSKFTEKIKCGHTFPNPLNQRKDVRQRILNNKALPFLFVTAESKLIITHNFSSIPQINKGDEIITINGFTAKEIIDSLLTVSRSDGNNSLGKKLNNINITPDEISSHTLFDIYFPLFFKSWAETYKVKIKLHAKKIVEYDIPLNTLAERVEKYEAAFGKVPEYESTWDYKLLDNQTAYMKFGTFAFWNSKFNTKRYVDSIFADLSSRKYINKLIIDIRGNEGGDDTYEYILSYITSRELGCDNPRKRLFKTLTIPDSLLPYLDTWDESFKAPKDQTKYLLDETGLYEEILNDPCETIKPQKNNFKGKVCLLIDAKNSSAGFQMAELFTSSKLGVTIGETTGGSQLGINGGQFFFLTLPNTQMEIDLPLIYGYHKGKPDMGIKPDIEILTTQRDIKEGRDPQLKEALDK